MLHRREDVIALNGIFGFGTNQLEGANNKIKVTNRSLIVSDFDYFALKAMPSGGPDPRNTGQPL